MIERNEELFELIERYLEGKLNVQETKDFENEIQANPDLRNEVIKHKFLHDTLQDVDSLSFRNKVKNIENELENEQSIQRSKFASFSWLKAAAFIIVLVGLYFIWNNNFDSTSNLYQDYYEPFPIEDVIRGENEELLLERVKKGYKSGKYESILDDIEKLVAEYPENNNYKLHLGNCYLNLDKDEKAIEIFLEIGPKAPEYEVSRWYLALSYLKSSNMDKAQEVLSKLIDYDGIYKEKATALLKDIR